MLLSLSTIPIACNKIEKSTEADRDRTNSIELFMMMFLDDLGIPRIVLRAAGLFLIFRIFQRLYYLIFGYKYPKSQSPNKDLAAFFKKHDLEVEVHTLSSEIDATPLQIKKVGTGKKYVMLANGVGTDLFMWLPIFECCMASYPKIFQDYTFILPTYRGLLTGNKNDLKEVEVTMANCMVDMLQIMKYFKIKTFDVFIGWSTGAQLALIACAQQPSVARKLFLLNPSVGCTLQSVLQPFHPLPSVLGKAISATIIALFRVLIPLCYTSLWPVLKSVAESIFFRILLECLAFFGGFPASQPVYFQQYMNDVFSCPTHTMALLNLIIALDVPCPPEALTLSHETVVISGLMDFMTGIYHSLELAQKLKHCKHVMFTMGSHFVLIEWPRLIAQELVDFLRKKDE